MSSPGLIRAADPSAYRSPADLAEDNVGGIAAPPLGQVPPGRADQTTRRPGGNIAAPTPQAVPTEAQVAVRARFTELDAVAQQMLQQNAPPSDALVRAWTDKQAALRGAVEALADTVKASPEEAPERIAAKLEVDELAQQLDALELPVLAKLDVTFGQAWQKYVGGDSDEGKALPKRLRLYKLSDDDVRHFIIAGEEPDGLRQALEEARHTGEYAPAGVVQALWRHRKSSLVNRLVRFLRLRCSSSVGSRETSAMWPPRSRWPREPSARRQLKSSWRASR